MYVSKSIQLISYILCENLSENLDVPFYDDFRSSSFKLPTITQWNKIE